MEAFLSTLPTYVHEYLDKYPPTDVFNLLKELVCFAVLYTEDRERLKRSTHEFLEKKEKEKEKVACVPETIQEDHTRKSESNNSNVHAQVDEQLAVVVDQKKKSAMPNTFPQWWGHQETESPSQSRAIDKLSTMPVSLGDESQKPTHNSYRLERARSQIIPNLRSYLNHHTETATTNSTSTNNKKRHSMLTMPSSSPSSAKSTSPTNDTRTANSSKGMIKQANTRHSPASPVTTLAAVPNDAKSTTPRRSASVLLRQPRENAAMRARAEHARLLQQEEERKKAAIVSPTASLRLKQRANSGVDWESIKRERRKTIIGTERVQEEK